MKRKKLPEWAGELPKAAQEELRKWRNVPGVDFLAAKGGVKRRGQEQLIKAGLMRICRENDVRLCGKALKMKSF